MTEIQVADDWLLELMSDNSNLLALLETAPEGCEVSVYPRVADQRAKSRYVVYTAMPGMYADDVVQGDTIVMTPLLYQVSGWVEGKDDIMSFQIADEIHRSLQGKSATRNGFKLNCIRTYPFSIAIVEAGKQYRQSGGRYQVLVRPAL